MPNWKKLATAFNEVAEPKAKSRYLNDGEHIVKIVNVETIDTNSGDELAFIEYEILESSGTRETHMVKNAQGELEEQPLEPHYIGEEVKQSFALNGIPEYRLNSHMGVFKVLARITNGVTKATPELLEVYMGADGESSPLVGHIVKVRGVRTESKLGKWYTKFSYTKLSDAEKEQYGDSEVKDSPDTEGTSKVEAVTLGSDEDPEF